MRHTNFIEKNSSFSVIGLTDDTLYAWKFTLTDGLIALDDTTMDSLGDYYRGTISTPDEDCYILHKQGGSSGICRIGNPEVLLIGYTGEEGNPLPYVHIDNSDGSEIESGDFTEIGEGFYYVEPAKLVNSFYNINGGYLKTLRIPYTVINVDSGSTVTVADKNFINTGYNMFGFLGEEHSYFDMGTGAWIQDDDVVVKASDIAKAVCIKYGLVWDDKEDPQWIGNYIQYIRSYDENAKKFRLYKPYTTPDTNDANFALFQVDEDGNVWLRGISLLLNETLETVNDVGGAIVTFR